MTTWASTGSSYGSEMPVNSVSTPARAFAYRPLRARTSEFLGDGGEREPAGEVAPFREPAPELGAGDIERARAVRDLVGRPVLVEVLHVHHLEERHHRHADFVGVTTEELLRVVRT